MSKLKKKGRKAGKTGAGHQNLKREKKKTWKKMWFSKHGH